MWREDILTLLYCFVKQILLNIEMKKIFTFAALLCATWMNAQEVYQLPNSGFEEWESVSYKSISGEEPLHWNSFLTGIGDLKGTAAADQLKKSNEVRPGSTGQFSAKLVDRAVKLGFITLAYAQGNMTTGCVSMNSASATDAKGNYNFTDINDGNFNQPFTGKPDAMKVWVKYYTKKSEFRAKVNTILHTSGYYQDPEANNITATLVAKAENANIQGGDFWNEITIPFEYSSELEPAYALVSFATNATPGKGTGEDYMLVDDLEYLYYSELASLNYDGQDYFQKGNTNYTIDALYDESKLTCTSNGRGATIEKSYYDEASAVLTITVKGNDFSVNPSNVHTYKVQFAKPQPVITEYENDLVVTINDQSMPSQPAKIQLIKEIDGTTSLALNNFVLGSGEDALAVGNIKLTNLEVKDGKIQATQDIRIAAGDDPAYEGKWFGPLLTAEQPIPVALDATIGADNRMEAVIDIPFASMGMIIKVTFAETQTYTDGQALSLNAGLTNIAYNRTFPEGWSTVCLPFATPVAALGAQSVQEFVSADESGLNFAEVETLEANKPYLIYFAAAKETPTYFGTEITSTTPVSVTKGDYTFVGSYDAVMSMSGKYGIATVDDVQKIILGGTNSTLKATRAYFTKKGEQPAQVRINLFGMGGDGEGTTGIDQIVNGGAQTYDVYTLQGVQVLKGAASLNGLQKGIYIVNGKKVVIK